jgi:hypothetical protein
LFHRGKLKCKSLRTIDAYGWRQRTPSDCNKQDFFKLLKINQISE